MCGGVGRGILSAAVAAVLVVMLTGCSPESRRQRADIWLEKLEARAKFFTEREWKACISGEGGLEPYGYGKILIATGGTKPVHCGKLFGLPGASAIEEKSTATPAPPQ